eukprot:NODE_2877_length_1469_cov_59.536404_g2488_i0.p1 GENE.NODE_2877_length_1469_cov_59.536404_g2488_i0~~NODE_2877_length_1469_cov_59.536404_g2488_i0.p1  ORF type:complete len:409 (+),score=73.75 NODE_2877_length_1469_cov_59.536404_g2488_i0:150-1376(+)
MVFTWGCGWNGRTGHNNRKTQNRPAHLSYLDQFNVKKISSKNKHMLALTENGEVLAWGSNEYGQLGLGKTQELWLNMLQDYHLPMKVQGLPPNIVDIAAGWKHSAALDSEGNVWLWGSNKKGELGSGCNEKYSSIPIKVPEFGNGGVKAKYISLGGEHSAVVDENGSLWTWGNDDYGRLGHGTLYSLKLGNVVNTPTLVKYFMAGEGRDTTLKVQTLDCGFTHTLVTTENNQVFAFGRNNRQQLGCDTGSNLARAQQFDCADVPTPVAVIASQVWTNYIYSACIDGDGLAMIWGGAHATPQLLKRTATKVFKAKMKSAGIGYTHLAFVTEKGRLYMLGRNTFGEMGVTDSSWFKNPFTIRPEPVPVEALKDYKVLQVACGLRCTAVLVEKMVGEEEVEDKVTDSSGKS